MQIQNWLYEVHDILIEQVSGIISSTKWNSKQRALGYGFSAIDNDCDF